jgi:large subunit ribosomal protein L29
MKGKDIVELDTSEILHKLDDCYQELMNLRMQVSIGQQKNTARLLQLRHDIARYKTALRERELVQLSAAEQEG